MNQYVQHISGQGEKWEVISSDNDPFMWIAKSPEECMNNFLLPKTEYYLCEPPEEWEDVTDKFGANDICLHPSISFTGLHIRKIDHLHNGPCFIVERKKS